MNSRIKLSRCTALAGFVFILIASAGMLCAQQGKKAATGPRQSVFAAKKNGHAARLVVRTRPFRKKAHIVESKDGGFLVDGKVALGTDGGIPKTEIESMQLVFDGKTVAIPYWLYRDVFEPHFEKGFFAVRFGDDLASLFVFMSGSDGAGSYQLLWVFRLDGRHSRFSLPCSDCGFLDFDDDALGWITQ